MNEHQQKAEAYVRGQIKELMELSFGCEVVVVWEQDDRDSSCHALVLDKDDWKGWLGVFNYTHRYTKVHIESDLVEIIGHPIQLQHWLKCLERVILLPCSGLEIGDGGLTATDFQGREVKFNLTTGQPATEADYQAFCNIVGI